MEVKSRITKKGNLVEVVHFNEVEFRRYPDSTSISASRYFFPFVNGNRAKGIGSLHREIWKYHNGEIPKGYQIHHIDGDFTNNDVDNLECVSPKQHSEAHADEFLEMRRDQMDYARTFASEWHGSPEGIEFHKKLGKQSWEGRSPSYVCECENCGQSFMSYFEQRDEPRFCVRWCINQYNHRTRRYHEVRECIACGGDFEIYQSSKQKTCSRKCGWVIRRQKCA